MPAATSSAITDLSIPGDCSGNTLYSLLDDVQLDENDTKELYKYVRYSVREEEDFHFLRFDFLQRINIVRLQVELARLRVKIHAEAKADPQLLMQLRLKLEQYATAIRNYEYIDKKQGLSLKVVSKREPYLESHFRRPGDKSDIFESHYAYFRDATMQIDAVRRFLMRILPKAWAYDETEMSYHYDEYHTGIPPTAVSHVVDRVARFLVGFCGGAFLVVPMVIMVINPSQTKSLVTASIAVCIFALFLSLIIKVSNNETMIATATYAAVLVVFVGTSQSAQ